MIFPPMTEAKLFPYLSLPILSSFLKANGHECDCVDLNLEVSRRLLNRDYLAIYADRMRTGMSMADVIRKNLAGYMQENAATVLESIDTNTSLVRGLDLTEVIRLGNNTINMLCEGSPALELYDNVEHLVGTAARHNFHGTDGHDLLTQALLYSSVLTARLAHAKYPSATIVFGGPQCMLRPSELVRSLAKYSLPVSWVCSRDGESALMALASEGAPPMVSGLHPTRSMKFGCEIGKPEVERKFTILNSGTPDFTDFSLSRYFNPENQIPVISCIGCFWGRCVFCSYGNRSRRIGYQQKAVDQLAAECQQLISTQGTNRINFVDEMTNLQLIIKVARKLKNQGISIRFSVRSRFERQLVRPEFCRELKALGCELISVGYETNSQRLLDKLDKGADARNFQDIIDNLFSAGIDLRLSVMGGILDETDQEFEESLLFLKNNENKFGIDVLQMLVCEPTTILAESAASFGIDLLTRANAVGNTQLSFGNGRVGFDFEVINEDGSFGRERTERRFYRMYSEVNPQVVDEIKPTKRRKHRAISCEPGPVNLLSHVIALGSRSGKANPDWGDGGFYLVDLVWQTVLSVGRSRKEKSSEFRRVLPTGFACAELRDRLVSLRLCDHEST